MCVSGDGFWLLVVWLVACGSPGPRPPAAVIVAEPQTVCEGDAFSTTILLDGRDSAARLTLVPVPADPDEAPLEFRWGLSGAEYRLVDGDLRTDHLSLTVDGRRPLHVTLRVENEEGAISEVQETLSVTTPAARPTFVCTNHDECGPCRRCVEGSCDLF